MMTVQEERRSVSVDGTESMVIDNVVAVNNMNGSVSLRFSGESEDGPELLLSTHVARNVVWQLAKALTVQ